MHAFERVLSRVAAPDGLRRRRIKGDGFPAPHCCLEGTDYKSALANDFLRCDASRAACNISNA
jgi:hypothetical protein